ncbi:sensor histidine kinase KdpD [Sanguibacter sp. HDW7]|nr:sensor histidine kinase KdpD [Sanguibacter sp. HDW7]
MPSPGAGPADEPDPVLAGAPPPAPAPTPAPASEPGQEPGPRGRLTVYLGAAPGVGKTCEMLDDARRRLARGTDVVVALVETHGRAETAVRVRGLPEVPRLRVVHRGVELGELDVDAVVARRPQVVCIDELAHSNAPGSRNAWRWQDVAEILAAGIDVLATVNVQHLESLGDDVEQITGVRQRETVPDQVVRDAAQVQLVDLTPQALRRRLAHGNVYRAEQIDASLASYFREGNLTALRELALLWLADRVDDALVRYRAEHEIAETWPARERVVVAVTGGPESETLLRRAARIAARAAGAELHAVHVLATDGLPSATADVIAAERALVERLGGTLHSVVGEDVAHAVVDLAQGVNATMVVVGVSRRSRVREALLGSTASEVARLAGSIDVHLVTHDQARARRGVRRGASPLSRPRRLWGWGFALVMPALLTWGFHGVVGAELTTQVLLFLATSVGAALLGGLGPALAAAIVSFLCLNWFFVAPRGRLTVAEPENLLALGVFVVISGAVALVVDHAARRSAQAFRARAEASALAGLSRSVLAGQDTSEAVVERLAETFGLARVELAERAGDGWRVLASASRDGVPEGTTTVVEVDDERRLVLDGRPLPAGDRRVLDAFAAQAGIVVEHRRLREEAARAAVAERSDAARSALLAAVSHDLRTPLAAMRTALDGLGGPGLDDDDRAVLLETASASTDRLGRLIDDLLDLSRLQAGAVAPALREVSLDEVVPLAVEPYLGLVTLDLPEDLPFVRTDAALLERVVENLVANAVRYGAGEPVLVGTSAVQSVVEVRIVDRGPGVDDVAKARMFQPFERLGQATGSGIGLGLAVADGLARAMGATIVVEDTPGGGLTAVVVVPRAVRDGEEEGER